MIIKLNLGFLTTEWSPNDQDKQCAWELYVELLTRITTQSLDPADGDEKTALDSVYSLFPTTREILKSNGRHCKEFTRLSVVVLNQIVRPFTAKWHKLSLEKAFEKPEQCQLFRQELAELQVLLQRYTQLLANMAGVEDLTRIDCE